MDIPRLRTALHAALGRNETTPARRRSGCGVQAHPYAVEQPIAPAVAAWGDAVDLLGPLGDDQLLAAHPAVAADVRQETYGEPGAADPDTIVLRQQRGFRRARSADTVTAGLVGAADGDLSTGQLLDALATLLARPPAELRADYLPVVGELVAEGFLRLRDA